MRKNQVSDWLRIVELKKAILEVALYLEDDEVYTRENAIKALIKAAYHVTHLEESYLEDVNKAANEKTT